MSCFTQINIIHSTSFPPMYSWQSLLIVVKTNVFCPLLHCVSEEAALVLGRDADLLDRIMEWCEAKDHAGVRGEASRLLAALIRHSQNSVSQIIHLGMFLCLCWLSNSLMFTYYLMIG